MQICVYMVDILKFSMLKHVTLSYSNGQDGMCFAVTLERTFESDSYISAGQYGQMSTALHCVESPNYYSLNCNNFSLGTENSPPSVLPFLARQLQGFYEEIFHASLKKYLRLQSSVKY